MLTDSLATATASHNIIPPPWIAPSQLSPLVLENPGLVWLEYYGAKHGFQPDTSPYEFLDIISEKSRQFEHKWLREMAPQAEIVCTSTTEVQSVDKVHQTFALMQQGKPVIAQPALWWAPERIYGVPDLLVHTSWLKDRFPSLVEGLDMDAPAPNISQGERNGHYVVMDLKFTTKLEEKNKAKDLENYSVQVRIYNYMLGQLQGLMPNNAFLITRDRVDNPLPVEIRSLLNQPLDDDLATIRDTFIEIKLNGDQYRPWVDEIVAINLDHQDDRWHTAKSIIAREYLPGGDASQLYYVGQNTKRQLTDLGYPSLASLLDGDPERIPFEDCKGIGAKTARRMRAILKANQTKAPVLPPVALVPPERPYEFFIDFEYFTNVNVDFESQWPSLEGFEMIFMIGIGRVLNGKWDFGALIAEAESLKGEHRLLERFRDLLESETKGAFLHGEQTAIYHWSGAEVVQSRRAADRHQLLDDHPLRNLPWVDLSKVFLEGPAAIPGSWDFGLKPIAKALSDLDPTYAVKWPGDLDEGQRVMVMGWQAYQSGSPQESAEMEKITEYLNVDCKALYKVLDWLRQNNRNT